MARNPIQSQDGLSLSGGTKRYGTAAQCEVAVAAWWWPSGFTCPNRGGTAHSIVGKRRLYECHACHRQTSLKSGAIFAKSLLPLTKWFQCMWLLTQSQGLVATIELPRQLDLKWDSAWPTSTGPRQTDLAQCGESSNRSTSALISRISTGCGSTSARGGVVLAGPFGEVDEALQLREREFDPPAQAAKIEHDVGRVAFGRQRRHHDDPVGDDEGAVPKDVSATRASAAPA